MTDKHLQIKADLDASGVQAGAEEAKRSIASIGDTTDVLSKRQEQWVARQNARMQLYALSLETGGRQTKEFALRQAEVKGIKPENLQPGIDAMERSNAVLKANADAAAAAAEQSRRLAEAERVRAEASRQAAAAEARAAAERARVQSQIDTYGKTRSELFALQAAQAGMTKEAQATVAAMKAAETQTINTALSTKQLSAAYRLLPAQITDIVTGLVSGQPAYLVAIQQGGQLKDSFGGFASSARELLKFLTPVRLLIGGTAAAFVTIGLAYKQGAAEAQAYNRALIISGNAMGVTTGQLIDMGRALSSSSVTQGRAAAALAEMAGSARIGSQNLERFTETAIRMDRELGQSIGDTRKEFEELTNAPLAGLTRLSEKYGFLTREIYNQVKALEDQGRMFDAARVAQEAYNRAQEELLTKLEGNLGIVERAWRAVTNAAKGAWDAMLNVGRENSASQVIKAIDEQIAALQTRLERTVAGTARKGEGASLFGVTETGRIQAQIAGLTTIRDNMREIDRLHGRSAEAKAAELAATKALAEFDKQGLAFLDKKVRMEKEIAAAIELGKRALLDEETIAKRVLAIREKYAEKGSSKAAERDIFAALLNDINKITAANEARLAGGGELTKAQELEIRLNEKLAESLSKLTAAQQEDIRAAIKRAVVSQDLLEINSAELKAAQAIAAARASARQAESQGIDAEIARQREAGAAAIASARDRIESLEDEEQAAAIMARTNLTLAEAIARVTIARLEEQRANLFDDSPEHARLTREIELREQVLGLLATKAAREANEKAAADAVKAWEKSLEQISQSLTDALMKGGKSAWEYIKGLFRATVLRPVIQAVVAPLSLALAGPASALAAAGTSTSGLAGLGSLYGAITSLPDVLSGGIASGFARLATTGIGNSLGLSEWADGPSYELWLEPTKAAQKFGATLGTVGATLAAFGVGRAIGGAIGGGYSAIGGASGNSALNLGGAVGAIFGPLGSAIGAALGGVVNRLFGTKLADSGVEGTLGGAAGFSGNAFEFFKGGLFRSDKTVESAIAPELDRLLSASVQVMRASTTRYAQALSLPVDSIEAFTQTIKLSFKDLAPEQIEAKVAEALAGFGAGLVEPFLDSIKPFAREGEQTAVTLQRLAEALTAVNPALAQLNVSLLATSAAGGDAASKLIDAFGGGQSFAASASSYYQKYFSDAERVAKATDAVTIALRDVGLQLPDTRASFRELVEAQDLMTESGRAAFVALLGVADAFDVITTFAQGLEKAGLEAQRDTLQDAIDALEELAGDFSVLEDPVLSLSEAFSNAVDELKALEDGLDALLGNTARTIQETLSDMIDSQRALQSVRASLADAIEEAALRGLSPEDRLAALRSRETGLFASLPTASDPVAVAGRLQAVVLARIKEEAGIKLAFDQSVIDGLREQEQLARDLRDEQIDALREQIRGAERLKRLGEDIAQFTGSLRFSDLSPLNPGAQLNAAAQLFSNTLTGAQAGDENARNNLLGNSRAYLEEAQQFFASSAAYAGIFSQVTAALDALGLDAVNADPQIAALEAQIAALEALNAKQSELVDAVIETSAAEVAGLTAIDTALALREDANATRIDTQIQLARDQITELQGAKEELGRQLLVAQEDHEELMEEMRKITEKLTALESRAATAEGVPT